MPCTIFQRLRLCATFSFRIAIGIAAGLEAAQGQSTLARPVITSIGQFRGLSPQDFLCGCPIRLTGVVTLVDTSRNLIAMQDETGAVAVNLGSKIGAAAIGERILLESSNCSPYVVQMPTYPFSPSGWDVRSSFEGPTNWGDYHLTRLRAFLHPPVSGDYTFWIASDNSSELWLSSDSSPGNIKRIALMERANWVKPREWSRYRSQQSEAIPLEAGHVYYIEAVQEQLLEDDNIAVAWQGPSISQSVIAGNYMSPWPEQTPGASGGFYIGALREYWTNYTAGTVEGVTGPRRFESIITPQEPSITVLGTAAMPLPARPNLNQPLNLADNFRWTVVEGTVDFAGNDGERGILDLTSGSSSIHINVAKCDSARLTSLRASRVRVQGVCEGVRAQTGELRTGFIWTPEMSYITPAEDGPTNVEIVKASTSSNPHPFDAGVSTGGFFWTRGIITFNDRVFGADYLIMQNASAAIFIAQTEHHLSNRLRVGELVELGGALSSGKFGPELRPMVIHDLGSIPMPSPIEPPTEFQGHAHPDGLWTELEGIVHGVNADESLLLMTRTGPYRLRIGGSLDTPPQNLIDAKLRVRGDLLISSPPSPLLLIPSQEFMEMEEKPSESPFAVPLRRIAELASERLEASFGHRVRLVATATYQMGRTFFAQDDTGAIRVQLGHDSVVPLGKPISISGFPDVRGVVPAFREAVIKPTRVLQTAQPTMMDPSEAMTLRHDGELIVVMGTLVDQKQTAAGWVFDLQSGQHMFEAILSERAETFPQYAPGSVLKVAGVCNFPSANALAAAVTPNLPAGAVFAVLLRSAKDVQLVHGPPWWTWKRTAALILALFAILCGAVLWIRLLRRRLQRQQEVQLAFSRQVLHGQESERRRIAANLHDSLGQNLLVIKNQVCLAMQSEPAEPQLRKRLDEISGLASEAIEEVRQITLGLRPYHLDRLGLSEAIRAAVALVAEHSTILFATHVDDIDAVFDNESEIHVYRIVQESVNNIIKHSNASEAAVVIKRNEASVALSIRDNGRGFEAGSNGAISGSGLNSITERVRILGGTLAINAQPSRGASISVHIPISTVHHAERIESLDRG